MVSQSVILLGEARARRAKALHVHEICWRLTDPRTIEALTAYAAELDKEAMELEVKAERTAKLSPLGTDSRQLPSD